MSLLAVNDYTRILRDARPLIDVRSDAEFRRGAVPGAVNLPLLTDEERTAVGRTYKSRGREAAVALGHELVADDVKAARVATWRDFATSHPTALITCWRGGLRSEIAQAWLAETGIRIPRVAGGFKALRHFCLDTILTASATRRFVLVGGRTGSGKTRVVQTAISHVDLEGLANHRGSAFGGFTTPQPPPVTFENALAVGLLKLMPRAPVVLEDESRTIGRLAIPEALYDAMERAPIVVLEVADAQRVDNIYREYVLDAAEPEHHLPTALARIERRLGGVGYREIAALMASAFHGTNAEGSGATGGGCTMEGRRGWAGGEPGVQRRTQKGALRNAGPALGRFHGTNARAGEASGGGCSVEGRRGWAGGEPGVQRRTQKGALRNAGSAMGRFQTESPDCREAHHQWIERLLRYYYDPMYDYQIARKKDRIVMRGSPEEVIAYLNAQP